MVGAYDGVLHKAYIIGIPRDTKVNVQRNVKKINAAYPVGNLNGGGHDGGVNQLRREVRTLIGFVPDYYISVDFNAVTEIVDAVNGIEIDVPYDMDYTDPEQDLRIKLNEGHYTLMGEDALRFARHRQNNKRNGNGSYSTTNTFTDYQRIENQQQVIKSLLNKVLQPSSLLKIPDFIGIFNENVKSIVFKPWEGAYLLGVIAAHVSANAGKPDGPFGGV